MSTGERTEHTAEAQHLEAAALLVQQALAALDVSVSKCDCCGAERYKHYGDYKVGLELEMLVTKLQRLARTLREGTTPQKTVKDQR